MKVSVCLGSACHVKGASTVVPELQFLIAENDLKEKIDLSGTFCTGSCGEKGVCIKVDDNKFSVDPTKVNEFFEKEVLKKL